MSSTESSNQNPVATFIGIDWADQKHAIVLGAAASTASLLLFTIDSYAPGILTMC
jgi:hypothetical protein